jgi:hypothetical protein
MLDETDVPQLTLLDLTADTLPTFCPALFDELRERFVAEGRQLERGRFEKLRQESHGNSGLLIKRFLNFKGEDLAAAAQTVFDLETKIRSLQVDEARLRREFEETPALRDQFSSVAAYLAEKRFQARRAHDEADVQRGRDVLTSWEAKVQAHVASHAGCTKAAAISACVDLFPELHDQLRHAGR